MGCIWQRGGRRGVTITAEFTVRAAHQALRSRARRVLAAPSTRPSAR